MITPTPGTTLREKVEHELQHHEACKPEIEANSTASALARSSELIGFHRALHWVLHLLVERPAEQDEQEKPWQPGKRRTPYDHAWSAEVDGVSRCECGARSDSDNYPVCRKSPEYARIFKLGQLAAPSRPERPETTVVPNLVMKALDELRAERVTERGAETTAPDLRAQIEKLERFHITGRYGGLIQWRGGITGDWMRAEDVLALASPLPRTGQDT